MALCTTLTTGEKKEEGGNIHSDVCLPNKVTRVMPLFPGSGWTFTCRWEVVNGFLALFCLCTWFLLYLADSLSQPANTSTFTFLILSHPTWGEWANSCVVLSCMSDKKNHNTFQCRTAYQASTCCRKGPAQPFRLLFSTAESNCSCSGHTQGKAVQRNHNSWSWTSANILM